MKKLPEPGYTAPEAEKLLELPTKRLYALIREGRISSYADCTGRLRVPYGEVYSILRERGRMES